MPQTNGSADSVCDKKVVLIDDDEVMIEIVTHLLNEAGFSRIHSFMKSTEALEELRYLKPDVIITDIHMPHLSGTFLAKLVSDFPQLNAVPLLAMTADDSHETRDLAQKNGFFDIVYKPINAGTLLAKVCTAIAIGDHSKRVRAELRTSAAADTSVQEGVVFDLFRR